MNLAMSLFVRLDATSMVTANWRGVSTSMRESSFSVPLGRMLLCHHWLEVSVAGLIGWVWTSWAFALGGCLISFPVDRLGAVLYRLLYFFCHAYRLPQTGLWISNRTTTRNRKRWHSLGVPGYDLAQFRAASTQ